MAVFKKSLKAEAEQQPAQPRVAPAPLSVVARWDGARWIAVCEGREFSEPVLGDALGLAVNYTLGGRLLPGRIVCEIRQ